MLRIEKIHEMFFLNPRFQILNFYIENNEVITFRFNMKDKLKLLYSLQFRSFRNILNSKHFYKYSFGRGIYLSFGSNPPM